MSFYSSLPEDARIGNQQLREVEAIQKRLKEDPKSQLIEKEKSVIQRAEKYQQYRNKFYQDDPDIDRDEFKTSRINWVRVRYKRRVFEIYNRRRFSSTTVKILQ